MNWRNIATVYLKELKDALRDRRTLFSTIVIPSLIVPVFTFSVGKVATNVIAKARAEIPAIVILGGEDSPRIVEQLRQSKKFRVVAAAPDQWRQQIADKKIRAAVEFPRGFEAGLAASSAPPVTIYYYEGEVKSSIGAGELDRFLRELRDRTVANHLAEKALPATLAKPFEFNRENVAPPEKVSGNQVGGFVPYVIIILCLVGAAVPATDLTAGEKERGTMETLLCSPVARIDLVMGKFFLVLTGSLAAMGCMLVSLLVTTVLVGLTLAPSAKVAVAAANAGRSAGAIPVINPLGILGVLAMVLPVAVMFSALTFAIGLFAKSAKEAQSYLGPLMFVVILPAVIGLLPGIDLNARLALVPLLNLSLVCREMLSGVWHWDYIALIFISSCIYAAAALAVAVKMFNRENVIFRT
jgi:sodium transport system permease protein